MHSARVSQCRLARAGITLIELLVVIAILLVLTAIAVPTLQQGMEERRGREAIRALNVYISSARNKALETGRPVGIVLDRAPGLPHACTTVRQAEVPLPYMGSSVGMVRLRVLGYPGDGTCNVAAQFQVGDFLDDIVRPGDTLQVNYGGLDYAITSANPDSDTDGFVDFTGKDTDSDSDGWNDSAYLTLNVDLREGQLLPWPDSGWSNAMPFQITRQPMPTAAEPLQLPEGMVVDLDWSGMALPASGVTRATFPAYAFTPVGTDATPIVILFAPNGGIYRIVRGGTASRVIDPIYLLVGRRERMRIFTDPADPRAFGTGDTFPAEDGLPNCFDMKNYWITLSPQTGLVTASEMHSTSSVDLTDPQAVATAINAVREYASHARGMGGR